MSDFGGTNTNASRGNSASAKLNSKSSTTPIASTKKDDHHQFEVTGQSRTVGGLYSTSTAAAGQAIASRPGSANRTRTRTPNSNSIGGGINHHGSEANRTGNPSGVTLRGNMSASGL